VRSSAGDTRSAGARSTWAASWSPEQAIRWYVEVVSHEFSQVPFAAGRAPGEKCLDVGSFSCKSYQTSS
jgi:hypothetical protein